MERETQRRLDLAIIRCLERDARASIQELADVVGAPRGVVGARLHALLEQGEVRVMAAYDPGYLGQRTISHLSVSVTDSAAQVAARLGTLEEAVFVSRVAGAHDLIVEVRVGSDEEHEDLMGRIRATEGVGSISTHRYTRIIKGLFISRYDGVTRPDELDRRLIELLQRDGRLPYAQLARTVNLTAPAVRARIQRLIRAGVMVLSAVESRGTRDRRLSLGLGISLSGSGAEACAALEAAERVEFAARCIGTFDALATIAGESPRELVDQVDALRALPGVRRVDTWTHLHVTKEDYYRQIA